MASGSGKPRGSQAKSHHWNSRIQKQSKWKTDSGSSRRAISSMKCVAVASSYWVVNDVVIHSPKLQAGGSGARPVSAVNRVTTSLGVGPAMTQ